GSLLASAGAAWGQVPDQAPASPSTAAPALAAPGNTAVPHTFCTQPACDQGCDSARWWVQGEYLLWRVKNSPIAAPLVTTGVPTGISGALGQDGTAVLFGDSPVHYGTFSGFRFGAGVALDGNGAWALEGDLLWLDRRTKQFAFASDAGGNPVLA